MKLFSTVCRRVHPDVLRRTCRGAGAGDARTQDLQDLCGVRRASRHPVELGPDPHHPGIHSAHPLPEPLDAGAVSRLQVQFRGRHHLPMDEGVLSAALRPFAEVYRRGALAHQRRVVEMPTTPTCLRPSRSSATSCKDRSSTSASSACVRPTSSCPTASGSGTRCLRWRPTAA